MVRIFSAGEAKVGADSAVVSLTMRTEDAELAKAVNRSAEKKAALSRKLKAAGIADRDIVFENFSSDSETGFLSNKVRKHTVNSPIRVTVRKETQFAAVALVIDADAELFYSGRKAEVSDRTEPQMKAAADAIRNLKRKVALYETEFNVKLNLVSFEELL